MLPTVFQFLIMLRAFYFYRQTGHSKCKRKLTGSTERISNQFLSLWHVVSHGVAGRSYSGNLFSDYWQSVS